MTRRTVRGPAGAVVHFDVPGPGMSQIEFDRRVASGEFTIVQDGGNPEPGTVRAPAERPSTTDRKADWVEYAVATGFAASEAEADEYTKAELVEQTPE